MQLDILTEAKQFAFFALWAHPAKHVQLQEPSVSGSKEDEEAKPKEKKLKKDIEMQLKKNAKDGDNAKSDKKAKDDKKDKKKRRRRSDDVPLP